MDTIQIRPSLRGDTEAFLKIEKENFSDPWSRAVFLETLDNPQYINLVAERLGDAAQSEQVHLTCEAIENAGCRINQEPVRQETMQANDPEICGFLCIAVIADEGHIDNVSVARTCRRQGVGDAMLAEGMRQARERGVTDFTLEVRVGNEAARALYEKTGFVCEGIRKNYYEHPKEDAAIYWKRKDTGPK